MPISALVVGHLVLDIKTYATKRTSQLELGGPPAYAAICAGSLGFEVDILSKVGSDFKEHFFKQLSTNTQFIIKTSSVSTKFELIYSNNLEKERQLRLLALAPKITATDLPSGHKWDIGIIAPVMGEISNDIVYLLREACSLLCLDPQGFCRHRLGSKVVLRKWWDQDILSCVDIIKPSFQEAKIMTQRKNIKEICNTLLDAGPRIVLITSGAQGCHIVSSDTSKIYHAPAFPSITVVDETGAGDCFLTVFSCFYQETQNILEAAKWATAACSFLIESKGPQPLPGREQVEKRANLIELHTID
ncbi:MAG: PfkB family carbohydrate kinase [Promethearchaeota archaeon]